MLIKMLDSHKDFKAGEQYEIDAETATKWLAAELCEQVEVTSAVEKTVKELDRFEQSLTEALEQRDKTLLETIKNSVKASAFQTALHVAVPTQPKKKFADFLKDVAVANAGNNKDGVNRLEGEYGSKLLAGSSGASGGFLVPDEFRADIMQVAEQNSFARARCLEIPMTSDTVKIPSLDQTGSSSDRSNHFGGVVFSWTQDDETKPSTEPAFKEITLQAREISGYTEVNAYLLNDSPVSVEAFLRNMFGAALGWQIDDVIMKGDGIGKPLGIINSGAAYSESRASSDLDDDLRSMYADLHPNSLSRAVWVIHPSLVSSLLNLEDTNGNRIWQINSGLTPQPTIYGLPLIVSDHAAASASKGDICLCDFSAYLLGARQELAIATSEHVNFLKGRITFRMTARFDGQPMLSAPIYLSDGSTQVSPFVVRAV